MNKLKSGIVYVWDEELIKQCDRLPAVVGRASMVHNLISVYGLLKDVQVVRSAPATYKDLKAFHSELYLDHLKKLTDIDDDYMPDSQDEEYGIVYDCPPVSDMYHLVTTIAGGSMTAAKCLLLGIANVAVNWCGGWHHAQRFGAEGFCYVNDIVLAIEMLKRKFPKVLYIDLDVHHGNGVQDAYNLSKSVFTLSFHKHEPGFYPGSGGIDDIGSLNGKGYSCNIPLKAGYSDKTLEYVFGQLFPVIFSTFMPNAIVVQCGADALAHDPHGGAALTVQSYCNCVQSILDKKKPTLLLGGGGYKHTNAARLWTSLLAFVTGVTLDLNIPEHDQWPSYGPEFSVAVEPSLVKDMNNKDYLDECIYTIKSNLKHCDCSNEEIIDLSSGVYNDGPFIKRLKTNSTDVCNTVKNETNNSNKELTHVTNAENTGKRKLKYSNFKCNKTSPMKDPKDVYEFVD